MNNSVSPQQYRYPRYHQNQEDWEVAKAVCIFMPCDRTSIQLSFTAMGSEHLGFIGINFAKFKDVFGPTRNCFS